MNRKQRDQNRATSEALKRAVGTGVFACPECGELTSIGHYVSPMLGYPGFFTCDKFYDATGRRINGQS